MVWIYVKIYGNDRRDEWYRNMLKMIVHPVCNEYKNNIKYLYFTKYKHLYNFNGNKVEDGKGEIIPKGTKIPEEEDFVRFIRFRLSVGEEKAEEVKERIKDLFMEKQGNELRFMVVLKYDVEDDLGKRYGHSNLDYTLNTLSGWCWYNLNHLNEETQHQQRRVNDLFHLVNNISIQPLITRCPVAEHQIIA